MSRKDTSRPSTPGSTARRETPRTSSGDALLPRDDRRARILDAALSEFAATGFHRASTNAIASRAQVAKGLVFHYFGSKEALFDAVGTHVVETLRDHFEQSLARAPRDVIGRIRMWSSIKLQLLQEDPRLWRFWLASLRDAPHAGQGISAPGWRARSEEVVKELLRRLLHEGGTQRLRGFVQVDDVVDAMFSVSASLEAAFLRALEEGGVRGEAMQSALRRLDRMLALIEAGAYEDERERPASARGKTAATRGR